MKFLKKIATERDHLELFLQECEVVERWFAHALC